MYIKNIDRILESSVCVIDDSVNPHKYAAWVNISKSGYISNLRVIDEYRGRKYASILLEYIKTHYSLRRNLTLGAGASGGSSLTTEQLVEFYERHGFKRIYPDDPIKFNTEMKYA